MTRTRPRGFALLELAIALIIVILLAMLTASTLTPALMAAQQTATRASCPPALPYSPGP
jgi:type II secretory pathway pseudopilin PulG